ncbi:unnamed protein product [Aureobasidium uvarum]|uniref:Uncharacterized protein n=1 Tax=Aureobasidium uvarum TaxID=2773716 RepID=A0A9N8KN16_9PEZI|nr:unnamed protein product [Aureobasidium uvarum]
MSGYEGQDPIKIAEQSERELNSHAAKHGHNADISSKHGHGASDSSKFFLKPGLKVPVGYTVLYTFKTYIDLQRYTNITLALESGVDEAGASRFPGGSVSVGGQGASNNRPLPESEGGDINPSTGKLYKAGEFEGAGGPETKAQLHRENDGGDDDVRSNVRN